MTKNTPVVSGSQLCTGLSVHRSNGQERCGDYEIKVEMAYSRRMHCYAGVCAARKDWVLVSRYASSLLRRTLRRAAAWKGYRSSGAFLADSIAAIYHSPAR